MIESVEYNAIETSNLNNQQFRLNLINEVKDSFITEIKERELMRKSLIVLSATSGSISIASLATVLETPLGIASASFSLAFSLSYNL